jgi:hypothetical protein
MLGRIILAAVLVASGVVPAVAGSLDLSVTSAASRSVVSLYDGGYDDWAVWGSSNTFTPLTATNVAVAAGKRETPPHPLGYTLTFTNDGGATTDNIGLQSDPSTQRFVVNSSVTGSVKSGIAIGGYPGHYPLFGDGFTLTVTPDLTDPATEVELYFGSRFGAAKLTASGAGYATKEWLSQNNVGYSLYHATLLITGTSPVNLKVGLAGALAQSASVFVEAATASAAIPVCEPGAASMASLAAGWALVTAGASLRRRRS